MAATVKNFNCRKTVATVPPEAPCESCDSWFPPFRGNHCRNWRKWVIVSDAAVRVINRRATVATRVVPLPDLDALFRLGTLPVMPADRSNKTGATIELPSPKVRGYLKAFGLAAVIRLDDGTVTCARDVGRVVGKPVAVYWTTAVGALSIMQRCREATTSDIAAIAAELRTSVTAHAVVVERAERAIAHMDALLAQAKRNGLMSAFNESYRIARRAAADAGKGFMPYSVAHGRFVKALYGVAAGKLPTRSLIADALGIAGKSEQQT